MSNNTKKIVANKFYTHTFSSVSYLIYLKPKPKPKQNKNIQIMAKIIEEEPLRGSGPFGGQMQRVSTLRRLTPQVIYKNNS